MRFLSPLPAVLQRASLVSLALLASCAARTPSEAPFESNASFRLQLYG